MARGRTWELGLTAKYREGTTPISKILPRKMEDRLTAFIWTCTGGHMVFLKPGEEAFVTREALARPLTGSGPEIIERLEGMEAAGIDNVAISVTGPEAARDLIQDFGRESDRQAGLAGTGPSPYPSSALNISSGSSAVNPRAPQRQRYGPRYGQMIDIPLCCRSPGIDS